MVDSSGAIRGELCSDRKAIRSMAMPRSPQPITTASSVTGSGVPRYVTHSQPT